MNNFRFTGHASAIASGSLEAMNWRRGLLLAGINLAVAVPMILMMEARDQKYALTQEEIMAKAAWKDAPKPPEPPTPEPSQANSEQAEQTVSFIPVPCSMWVHYSVQETVLQSADLPSVALAGWGGDCPPRWSLAGRLREKMTWPPTPLWMETQRKIDAGLCLFIAIQWFLIGGFPLVRTQKWWANPGSFITACAVLAGAIALIPVVDTFARLPALIAMLAWFWWFGLLVWKALQFGWRMTTAWWVPRSS
ncbi:MAG: hypothetical protein ABSC48_18060 [Terracidiphilus sp.]